MDNIAKPLFKQERYSQGLKNVYTIFAGDISKEYNVTLENKKDVIDIQSVEDEKVIRVNPIIVYFIIGIFMFDIIFNRARIIKFLF